MKPMYIRSACAISPQHTFDRERFLEPVLESDSGRLYAVDAEYSKYISPVAIRRMSRLLKMAISAAMQCLKESGVVAPTAVITGTGRGSILDMETFLKDMIRLNEEALNPTYFIQSTYNSPNGWIAMQSKCTAYNQTYVHRGSSFELALLDAQLMISENATPQNALVGSYDEMTSDYFLIRRKIGYWKAVTPTSTLDVLNHADTPGSIGGEGSAFFVMSTEQEGAATAVLSVQLVQHADDATIRAGVAKTLEDAGISAADVDVLLTGISGDARFMHFYGFRDMFTEGRTAVCAFKHLSGEYDTATGFGLWLGDWMMRAQKLPPITVLSGAATAIRYILFVNHYIHGSASIILLKKAGA